MTGTICTHTRHKMHLDLSHWSIATLSCVGLTWILCSWRTWVPWFLVLVEQFLLSQWIHQTGKHWKLRWIPWLWCTRLLTQFLSLTHTHSHSHYLSWVWSFLALFISMLCIYIHSVCPLDLLFLLSRNVEIGASLRGTLLLSFLCLSTVTWVSETLSLIPSLVYLCHNILLNLFSCPRCILDLVGYHGFLFSLYFLMCLFSISPTCELEKRIPQKNLMRVCVCLIGQLDCMWRHTLYYRC